MFTIIDKLCLVQFVVYTTLQLSHSDQKTQIRIITKLAQLFNKNQAGISCTCSDFTSTRTFCLNYFGTGAGTLI